MKNIRIIVLGAGLIGISALHVYTTGQLKRELREVRTQLSEATGTQPRVEAAGAGRSVSLGTLPSRVSNLEQRMAELTKTSEFLTDRGIMPPSPERADQMKQRFFDPNASDNDRLRAFRMMRRSGEVTDDLALQAVQWAQTSTNMNTRRELFRQLDGLTNSTLKQPLLGMLANEKDGRLREELVDVLGDFASDPAVESKLWELALNDPNGDVREQAEEHLTEGTMTGDRLASLRQKAADANLPLEARLLALRGLREANATAPEVIAEMASLAQTSADPVQRARLFDAFDGLNDPNLMPPLVYGLQDPNPIVRERAADALSAFASNPEIQQWLNFIIQNDADPRVKREAYQALEQAQRGRGR